MRNFFQAFLLLVLTFHILIISESRPLTSKKVLWAVNSGSYNSKRANQGFVLEKDQNFDRNVETIAVDYSTDSSYNGALIKYTKDPEIYMTERHSYKTFKYDVPLSSEGTFTIILKFCEMFFTQPDKRVFNIRLGDTVVVQDLDVVKRAGGKFIAYDEYIEFEYSDGQVKFNKKPCINAVIDGFLQLYFEKTQKDNPIVNGVILYEGGLHQTDFFELNMYKEEWDKNFKQEQKKRETEKIKKQEAKMKKKEKIIIRNDHLDEMEEEFEEVEFVENKTPQKKAVNLRDLLMTPMGVVAMIGAFTSSFVIIVFTLFDPYGQKKHQKLKEQQHEHHPQEQQEDVKQKDQSHGQQTTQQHEQQTKKKKTKIN